MPVPPLPITPSFGGEGRRVVVVGRDWDDDETTMENFDGSTMEGEDDLGEVVDVLGTGMAARAEVVGGGGDGSTGSTEGEGKLSTASSSWTVRPRPLPVPVGGGARESEPWVKVVRKLPEVPS